MINFLKQSTAYIFSFGVFVFQTAEGMDTNFSSDMRRSLPSTTSPFSRAETLFDDLIKGVQMSERQVQDQIKKEVNSPTRVLVLGTTGSGKSTLVHALADKKLIAEIAVDSFKINISDGMLPNFSIGHDLNSSTSIPVSWYDQKANLVYWDCPGFIDSRGENQEIINSFSINQLFSPPSRIKVLLAIQESDFEGARGMEIINRFNKIISLLPNPNQLKNALTVVITKKTATRFSAKDKLKALLTRAQKSLSERTIDTSKLQKATDLIDFIIQTPNRLFTFPEPIDCGLYTLFLDKQRLIETLKSTPVINPLHGFELGPDVKITVLTMMKTFANIPQILFDIEDFIQSEYRTQDLPLLKIWKGLIDKLTEKLPTISLPSHLSLEMKGMLSSTKNSSLFNQLLDRLATSQRYIEFAKKVEEGCGGDLTISSIANILRPILKNIQSELDILIQNKEFLKRQQEATKDLESRLNQEVQSGKKVRAEADEQLRNLQSRLQNERAQAESKMNGLVVQINSIRSEAERERQNQLAAQERRYDTEISNLRQQLNRADRSSEISDLNSTIRNLRYENQRLQERIFELEQSRSYRGGGQVVFIPGLGFVRYN